jgi:uncharacterized membrane protein YfcA
MLTFVLIGLIVGLVLGLTGAGGSIFAVPLLLLFTASTASDAMGMALGAVCASALFGAVIQRKFVLWRPALILAVTGMLTAPFGKQLASSLDQQLLLLGFSVLATTIAVRMLISAHTQPKNAEFVRARIPSDSETREEALCPFSSTGKLLLKPKCLAGLSIGGIAVGFASGLFGVGGGFLIVPLLLRLNILSMQTAVASSLVAIALISGSGFAFHLISAADTPWLPLLALIFTSVLGMQLSAHFSKKISGKTLQQGFALLLLITAIVIHVWK